MFDYERKLVTKRIISSIEPIPNADNIEVAKVDGWKVIVRKNDFKVGQECLYFEIDSFLPDGVPAWQFLVDKSSIIFNDEKGHVLRTIKLRNQISQGLILPVDSVTNDDISKVFKYEKEIPASLKGLIKGKFPHFIPKTYQERCQNIVDEILNDYSTEYYVTIKMDGRSFTAYSHNGKVGVCSRNLEFKLEGNDDNLYVKMFMGSGLSEKLATLGNYAIQGELIGPGIRGNKEKLSNNQLFIFDIFDIDNQKYLLPIELHEFWNKHLKDLKKVHLVPIPTDGIFKYANILSLKSFEKLTGEKLTIEKLLELAEGPSFKHKTREGLVFKAMDKNFSFKVISNLFLLKE